MALTVYYCTDVGGDVRRHNNRHARAYLANEHTERHGSQVVAAVAKEFGGVCADPRLGDGSSYWSCNLR
jgi:hypothetical protein